MALTFLNGQLTIGRGCLELAEGSGIHMSGAGIVIGGSGGIVITPDGTLQVHNVTLLEGHPDLKACFTGAGGLQVGAGARAEGAW
jgi:hypothetical protein